MRPILTRLGAPLKDLVISSAPVSMLSQVFQRPATRSAVTPYHGEKTEPLPSSMVVC